MKLRLYRTDTLEGYRWFIDNDGQKCPVTLKLNTIGWQLVPDSLQEYVDVDIITYGEKFRVSTQWGKLAYIERIIDEDTTQAVDEFFISSGHPAAEFFWKEVTFDDGVPRVVRIAQMKPTQPY